MSGARGRWPRLLGESLGDSTPTPEEPPWSPLGASWGRMGVEVDSRHQIFSSNSNLNYSHYLDCTQASLPVATMRFPICTISIESQLMLQSLLARWIFRAHSHRQIGRQVSSELSAVATSQTPATRLSTAFVHNTIPYSFL